MSGGYLQETGTPEQFADVNVVNYLPMSAETIQKIKEAALKDPVLQRVKTTILRGWPDTKRDVRTEEKPYFTFRDELTVESNIIYKGQRLVVPATLRDEIKKKLHASHMGVESTLRRARECVFWPQMNSELKDYITACEICQAHSDRQQKETLKPHPMTSQPWERVGADFMECKEKTFLVIVDYYSGFFEVDQLRSTTSAAVIRKMKAHFARYGSPSVLVSDNGPQFSSEEFAKFTREWDFEHVTSSPGHAQSNGMAEAAVKTAKKILRRAMMDGSDPYPALLEYRNTPRQGLNASPVQLLMGKRTRSTLPTTTMLLRYVHGSSTASVRNNF